MIFFDFWGIWPIFGFFYIKIDFWTKFVINFGPDRNLRYCLDETDRTAWSGALDFRAELKNDIFGTSKMTYLGPQFPIDADHDAENHGNMSKPISQRTQEKISRSGIPHFDLAIL